jgi:drug/metabolite transporter (DMT)-like permease
MTTAIPYFGEILALLTAIVWAFGVICFKKSGETVHPIALNLFRIGFALLLLIPTMLMMGEDLLPPLSGGDYALVMFSGVLGIGISDTLFFRCLNLLGAGLSAVVDCLYSPVVVGLSILWLGERLSAWQVMGVIMIISAVFTATRREPCAPIPRSDMLWGVFFGATAMLTMGVGIVMIKPLLDRAPIFWTAQTRLFGGLLSIGLVLALHPRRARICGTLAVRDGWGYTIAAAFFGTYLAFVLWLSGMKYANVSIAAALNQTNNIFIFIFAWLFLREPITPLRTLGIGMGVTGAALVTFA